MSISEKTAMARARTTKASFPKGRITARQAAAMFVAMADSQVGYVSGNPNYSIYGKPKNWRTNWGGRQVYWCALFGGWNADQCFGPAAALAGFGRQSTAWGWPPVGGTWTVWVYNWARANGRVVRFEDARAGDIVLTNWGRTGAVVDHYDIVTGSRSLQLLPVIGGNTSPGNASAGAGVYRAWRPKNRVVVVVRPDYDAVARVYNQSIIEESDELSAAAVKEIKDHIDVLRRERTNAHLEEEANQERILDNQRMIISLLQDIRTKQDDLRNGINVVGRVAAEGRDKTLDEDQLITAIFSHLIQDMSFEWWVRNGLVLDKTHRQYPADPGSLADLVIRIAETVLDTEVEIYDGTQKRPIGPGNPHTQAELDLAVEVDQE